MGRIGSTGYDVGFLGGALCCGGEDEVGVCVWKDIASRVFY